jgi:hypothetical protein
VNQSGNSFEVSSGKQTVDELSRARLKISRTRAPGDLSVRSESGLLAPGTAAMGALISGILYCNVVPERGNVIWMDCEGIVFIGLYDRIISILYFTDTQKMRPVSRSSRNRLQCLLTTSRRLPPLFPTAPYPPELKLYGAVF